MSRSENNSLHAEVTCDLLIKNIAANGGGILNSARRLQLLSEDALFERTWPRVNEIIRSGSGAVETIGKVANIFITRPIPSVAFFPYAFGSQLIEHVILQGEVV